ncbi:hypothetical protein Gpo141_00012285 [Globisporangium polare]
MDDANLNHDSSRSSGDVVFRRRVSALGVGSAAVNDRSSYEARSVFELDTLSAIGAIVNTPDGVHRFFHNQHASDLWLDTLERGLLRRYLERILAFYPTTDETIEFLGAATGHDAHIYDPIEPPAGTDAFVELVYYAVFGLLSTDPRAALVARSGIMNCRMEDLLADSKQRALPMLVEWITQSGTSARTEVETALLDREDRPSVKRSLRHFRRIIRRELQLLRDFVTRFVSDINEKATSAPDDGTSSTIMQTHIPETFLSDTFCVPPRVKCVFLSDIEQLQLEPTSSVKGALVDVIDPSLNCRILDCNSRRTQRLPIVTFTSEEPEVFSAYGHGGQSSSSHASKTPLLSRGKSPSFQWLPSDVMVRSMGTAVVESEINCIHPAAFPAIYTGMEHLIPGFLPLFEQVLVAIATAKPPPPSFQTANSLTDFQTPPLPKHFPGFPREVVETPLKTDPSASDTIPDIESDKIDTGGSALTETAPQEHWKAYLLDHRVPPRPQLIRNSTSATPVESHAFSLEGRRIQVIPKVSTIRLTPDNPKFAGKSGRTWQIDGDSDERLVAIGFHVLEHENITTPEISFRAFAHKPPEPSATRSRAKDEFLAFGEKIAGYHGGSYGRTFLQPWGSMALLPDRSFAVPAFLAHRLEPFELLSPSSPGRLTLVTLFLVDPTQTIASTATLRPEQHDRRWVEANVDLLRDPLSPAAARLSSTLLGRSGDHHECCETRGFPDEIAQLIADFAASDALSPEVASRRRRHEIRFLHPARTLEQLRIALPDACDAA